MLDPKIFFENPKKTRITVLCSLVALLTLGTIIAVCLAYAPGADAPPAQSEAVSGAPGEPEAPAESEAPSQILVGTVPNLTIDEAREMALADAGVSEREAEVSREALAQDNGVWVYEFRFRTETARYEYKLNANTGEVRSLVKEIYTNPSAPSAGASEPAASEAPPTASPQPAQSSAPAVTVSQPPASTPAPAPAQSSSLYIGIDRAKAIALEHAGLSASEVTFTHASMDREHNTMVYEIEFRQGRVEYEYEIDAATGSILSFERDGAPAASQSAPAPSQAVSQPSAPVYISTDQAKAIALGHAGLSADQATFTHAQLHQEHGTMVYEIEFRQDRVEYEYEIDAATGTILDFERDAH